MRKTFITIQDENGKFVGRISLNEFAAEIEKKYLDRIIKLEGRLNEVREDFYDPEGVGWGER